MNADAVNIQNAMQYGIMLGAYAPFMLLAIVILAIINTPKSSLGAGGGSGGGLIADVVVASGCRPGV